MTEETASPTRGEMGSWSGTEILDLKGSPREVGRQHGEERRAAIDELVAYVKDNFFESGSPDRKDADLEDYLGKLMTHSSRYFPELTSELEGIAEGANAAITDIVGLNAFLDLINVRHRRLEGEPVGCTSFAVAPPASRDGEVYLGQNYDVPEAFRKAVTVARIAVTNTPVVMIATFAGVVGCAGLNSKGLGVVINFLHASDAASGVSYPFIVRKVLAQQRIGDAIGAATVAVRASGMHYLLAHEDGLIASAETSGHDHEVSFAQDGMLAHANHYCCASMRRYDLMIGKPSYSSSISRRGSTLVRQHFAEQCLRLSGPEVELTGLMDLCRNHENYPYSICFHGDESVTGPMRVCSVMSLIFALKSRRTYLADGIGHSSFHPVPAMI